MLHTKLILVEGLPGSGKSTIGQFIGIQLKKSNKNVEWFSEGDIGHPIDLGEIIDKESFEPTAYMESRIEKWKHFVERANTTDTITVLESSIFQHPINALLFENIDDSSIIEHISTAFDIIEPLNPVLIYFYQHDVNEAIKKASKVKGENWANRATQTIASTLFANSRNLQGFDGLVEYFLYRCKLESNLSNILDIMKLQIENSAGNWDDYRNQILNYLQLDKFTDKEKDESILMPFVGTFYNEEKKCTFEFVIERGELMDKKSGLAMVYKEEGVFYLPGLPTELVFQRSILGKVDRMVISGRENIYMFRKGMVFKKVI